MRVILTLLIVIIIEFNLYSVGTFQQTNTSSVINSTDNEGKKQGYWVVTGSMKPESGYDAESTIEEGNYIGNKKDGLWKKYFKTGKLKNQITYKANLPNGEYKIFYENGKVEEEGFWDLDKNTGKFKRYYSTGQISQDFNFNTNGKRNGNQKYYFENGTLNIDVEIKEGTENGKMKRYYPNGDLEEEAIFINGKMDEKTLKNYEPKKPEVINKEEELIVIKSSTPVTNAKTNLNVFNADGNNTLYNNNMQVTQIGIFKSGRLWNGRWKKYNKNGILIKIEIYKEGIYVGDSVIDEEDKK
jgi:antitoxin component YwqK of YwqJK toxin-antitoxin module